MNLSWRFLLESTGGRDTYLDWLARAWGWTLSVSVCALVVGTVMGTIRTLDGALPQRIGNAWTELFRNIPVLVQLFAWYQVLPALFPPLQAVPSFLLVTVALGLFTSARVSEQVRAGIQAIPRGQRMAGLALGLTRAQTYRHVLLPVAFRIVVPPLTTEAMNIVKNSAVAFAVSVPELTSYAMQVQEETSRSIEVYAIVTLLYFVSSFAVNRAGAVVERRLRIPGGLGAR
ncbi:MAG TPA: amino acid ABC transporter permease [Burkholderiaceae bacterium]